MTQLPKHGAVLFGKDLPRLAQFYVQVAGLQVTVQETRLIVMESATYQLVLHAVPAEVAKRLEITRPPALRQDLPVKLVFPVASLAAARQQAEQCGGGLGTPAQEWEARNFRACDGFDPEGNVVQLREAAGE